MAAFVATLTKVLTDLNIVGGPPEELVDGWLSAIEDARRQNKSKIIGSINAFHFYLLSQDPEVVKLARLQTQTVCDGFGMKLLLKFTVGKKVSRVSYPDFIPAFLEAAVRKELRIALLGYAPFQSLEIQRMLPDLFPGLQIVGFLNGFASENEIDAFLETCRNQNVDALFIGMGMPKQEFVAYRAMLIGAAFSIFPCGATFLYVTGIHKRGPKWITNSGFEWLWRLMAEPKRLGIRTLKSNLHLITFVIWYKLRPLWLTLVR